MSLTNLIMRCNEAARKSGWQDREIPFPEMCALIHSEVSEALEEWRNNKPLSYDGPTGKPEGIGPEFADILIRLCHYCALLEIDLDHEVTRKLAYNMTREYRHGGKRA